MSKKVLFLNLVAFTKNGGIERFNKCFLKALNDLDDTGNTISASLSAYDNDVNTAYYQQTKYKGFNKNKGLFVIASLFKASQFDIIFLAHINLAMVGVLIKKLFPSKKVVLITHGIEVWKPLTGIKAKVLSVCDLIISVSDFTRQKLVKENSVPIDKIKVFPNTIDPYFPLPEMLRKDNSLRNRYGIGKDDFVLYTLTRLANTEAFKGYDNVIATMGRVVAKYPYAKYVIGGKYSDEEKTRVDKLVKEYGLENNIILTGFLDEEELVAHYQMADLYIMPSKKEGFGIVFIEALVCGLPVIAGNADGSVDALKGGELGTLVNPDSIDELEGAIVTHIDKDIRSDVKRSERLKMLTLDSFSFDRYKERLKNIIAAC
ncbi:MAG: glycosyltransferase family 4 protein [Chitinophagales bacterium]|nr:glycosyltransferase family 4 protein [Chitinophagaceae bacterium]MCB9064620.1 glycosyltransferase family 4 protein [Chitinophagales bacterium]